MIVIAMGLDLEEDLDMMTEVGEGIVKLSPFSQLHFTPNCRRHDENYSAVTTLE